MTGGSNGRTEQSIKQKTTEGQNAPAAQAEAAAQAAAQEAAAQAAAAVQPETQPETKPDYSAGPGAFPNLSGPSPNVRVIPQGPGGAN